MNLSRRDIVTLAPVWKRKRGPIIAFLLGMVGGAGGIALYLHILDWYHRPKCPHCGKRMKPV